MKNKIIYLPVSLLTLVTALSVVALSSYRAAAVTSDATVTVSDACGFTSSGFDWVVSAVGGQSYNTESETKSATVTCNDPDGFVIKAAGNPDTDLSGNSTGLDIATGTSGSSSYWAFKVTSATNNVSGGTATIAAGYNDNDYHNIPAEATPIITYSGSATSVTTGSFRTDYKVSISTTQAADTYTGGVEYTIVAN